MSDEFVIIHARFAANGTIAEISERPQGLNPQEWFDFLSYRFADKYSALAGGRGVFRLTRTEVEASKADATAKAA